MEKQLKKIGTELGVKLSLAEDSSRFPADFNTFNEVYKLEDFDVAKMLKTAKKLATSYPDLPEAQHRLISLLLMADKRNAARKLLKPAADKFLDDISLAATYITVQENPEASLAEGFRLGTPPDLNRFRPQPDGSYNIEDYLSFELCALRLDIAANRVPSLWQRMERLLFLRVQEDVGGVWGYANFLEIINNPDHEEYKEMLEWAGGAFDPEAFDADEINAGWV